MAKELFRLVDLDLKGRRVPVRFVRNNLSRRIILRLDQNLGNAGDGVVVTLPKRTSVEEGLNFVLKKVDWVIKRLDSLPPRIFFTNGSFVPLGGVNHTINHTGEKRGIVRVEEKKIFIPGEIDHLARRAKDWLKKEARSRIQIKVSEKATLLRCEPGRISIRDTKSRWGSCSYDGNLSFNWRLVMAPESVLDYVVAHEVAHLIEHNHSPKFWNLVQSLTKDMVDSRKWLQSHGEGLHRIG